MDGISWGVSSGLAEPPVRPALFGTLYGRVPIWPLMPVFARMLDIKIYSPLIFFSLLLKISPAYVSTITQSIFRIT
jgi:hypothetical protein